eukprot:2790100-Ditylum_brightwellii.AAC.1
MANHSEQELIPKIVIKGQTRVVPGLRRSSELLPLGSKVGRAVVVQKETELDKGYLCIKSMRVKDRKQSGR